MCQHCGYQPGTSKVLQTITIFEKDVNGKRGIGAHFEATSDFDGQELQNFDPDSIINTGYRIGTLGGELHDFGLALEIKQQLESAEIHESIVDLTSLGIGKGD